MILHINVSCVGCCNYSQNVIVLVHTVLVFYVTTNNNRSLLRKAIVTVGNARNFRHGVSYCFAVVLGKIVIGKRKIQIVLRNVHLKLDGGVQEYKKEVPEEAQDYLEVFVYGRILPAKGIYFRHINGLTLENVKVETYRQDTREDFVFENVNKDEKK